MSRFGQTDSDFWSPTWGLEFGVSKDALVVDSYVGSGVGPRELDSHREPAILMSRPRGEYEDD